MNESIDRVCAPAGVDTADIKPCPFCGPNMIEHLAIVNSKEGPAKVVKCWACGAVGPYGASNEALAIEFWNIRL